MKKKRVLALALLLLAVSFSTQANARESVSGNTYSEIGPLVNTSGTTAETYTYNEYDFTNNTNTASQGGFFRLDNKSSELNIINSTFTENEGDTGAVALVRNGVLNIENTNFENNDVQYGVIYQTAIGQYNNDSTINITGGSFKDNTGFGVVGVGIFNKANIDGTTFEHNVSTKIDNDGGGAIYVGSEGNATIKNAKFIANESKTGGGAIGTRYDTGSNNSNASLIIENSTFTGNIAGTSGGAIENYFYNNTSITDSTFTGNIAAQGGAIYNHFDDDTLTSAGEGLKLSGSTFTGNTAQTGGAIYTESKMDVTGTTFKENVATTDNGGGAMKIKVENNPADNVVTIVDSHFLSNKATSELTNDGADGGAISIAKGNVDINKTEFIGNESVSGGAIYTYGSVGDVNITDSLFKGNTAIRGAGAIANTAKNGFMTISNTEFIENNANTDGGALFVGALSQTNVVDSKFIGNTATEDGGAIATRDNVLGNNAGTLLVAGTEFTDNTSSGNGGAIYNAFAGTLITESTFDGNSSTGNGGAIYNELKNDSGDSIASTTLVNTNLTNNSAAGGLGGAIYGVDTVNIISEGKDVVLSGNTDSTGSNDIYMDANTDNNAAPILTFTANNGGKITVASGISGTESGYSIIAGNADGNGGTLDIQSKITNADLISVAENTTLWLNTGSDVSGVDTIAMADGSTLDTTNGQVDNFDAQSGQLVAQGNLTVNADVDMASGEGDQIGTLLGNTASNQSPVTVSIGEITAVGSSSSANGGSFNIYTALGLSEDQVDESTVANTIVNDVMNPIRRLSGSVASDGTVTYAPTGNSYNDFNSAAMVAPIATMLGGYLNQLNSYDEAFRNMDMYMLMTKEQRLAKKFANKYAVNESTLTYQQPYSLYAEKAGFFRPYANFESVRMDNGPKVSNVAWGSYAGLESEIIELNEEWDGIFSVYAGYNGSHQAYQGNSIYQNGGTFGATGVAYKGNFFTGLTANIGANIGEADTMYGSEDFSMLTTGIASKTGYNFELADGKFIVQPNFMMAYSMVNTFDYTNAAGYRINTEALHAFTFEPGVKFIGNLGNGWQPYAGVSVVMNAINDANFKAQDASLPELSIKPYAKYGVGVRKTWGERFTGFLQAFVTSGGRDGIGFQGGFRWQLGKTTEKVQQPTEKKFVKAGTTQNPII